MKTTAYADSFEVAEVKTIAAEHEQSVLTDSAWVRLSPVALLLIFMWLFVANFLGWW
ncbi:MAG: hypothetical protein SOX43_06030 [Pelistega sp.]|nr:hypothetical protein [Pelistega sp.]